MRKRKRVKLRDLPVGRRFTHADFGVGFVVEAKPIAYGDIIHVEAAVVSCDGPLVSAVVKTVFDVGDKVRLHPDTFVLRDPSPAKQGAAGK